MSDEWRPGTGQRRQSHTGAKGPVERNRPPRSCEPLIPDERWVAYDSRKLPHGCRIETKEVCTMKIVMRKPAMDGKLLHHRTVSAVVHFDARHLRGRITSKSGNALNRC